MLGKTLLKHIITHRQISNFKAWEYRSTNCTLKSSRPNLRRQSWASGCKSYSPALFNSFLHAAGLCQFSVLDVFLRRAKETANIAKLQHFARRASRAEAAQPRTCCPCLADQTDGWGVYCREEEATSCPSTCLTCLASGRVCGMVRL